MIIAVTQRIEINPHRKEILDTLDQGLIKILTQCGFIAIPVPNVLTETESRFPNALIKWLEYLQPKGIVLSGGQDRGVHAERDQTEALLLEFAKKNKLPLLGICRGMQMMGVWTGGRLQNVSGHVKSRHKITGEINDEVNSFHNLSFVNCPPGYEILAQSEDGSIEAIKHKKLPWQGWMWHPEREKPFSGADLERIKKIFKN
tara:strand:- start:32 stop:637 length:606 start_codon:yes stop_codon:yes gene_type:complete